MTATTLAEILRSGRSGAQLLRFGLLGCVNTLFSYGVYSLGILTGLGYPLASLMAMVLGILVSFSVQGRLVFKTRLRGRFTKYLAVWGTLYVINVGCIALLSIIGVGEYRAGLLALLPVLPLAFVLQKRFVFR